VVVDGATDLAVAGALIEDFNRLYPAVAVDYRDSSSAEIQGRFLNQRPGDADRADVLWSSAMDLQVKLVNDGHAQRYASPEAPLLPPWAVWRDEVGFAYSRRHLAAHEVPATRRDFVRLIESDPERFRDRVVTYDLEASGLGFLFATQDARTSDLLWAVARALGGARAKEMPTSAAMLQSLAAGDSILAYNVLGTYAQARRGDNAAVGFVQPRDYTLVGSRIAFIAKGTAHPNAARLWLDHLLSRRGQTVLARRSGLLPIRGDIEAEPGAAPEPARADAGASLKPIPIGPSLMTYLDRSKRQAFLRQWKQALGRP
jgi:iron(III) transport system substrate-binding protein